MRLRERELIIAELVKRSDGADALGGCPETFSQERISFRASVLPEEGEMERSPRGMLSGGKIRLLAPEDLDAAVGDGVYVNGAFYVVLAAERWTAHRELVCGARA